MTAPGLAGIVSDVVLLATHGVRPKPPSWPPKLMLGNVITLMKLCRVELVGKWENQEVGDE